MLGVRELGIGDGAGFLANSIIYAELCADATSVQEVDDLMEKMNLKMSEFPRTALFAASKAYLAYRKRGGTKNSPLPDFFIGAHAEAMQIAILTRDAAKYKSYFPSVPLIAP